MQQLNFNFKMEQRWARVGSIHGLGWVESRFLNIVWFGPSSKIWTELLDTAVRALCSSLYSSPSCSASSAQPERDFSSARHTVTDIRTVIDVLKLSDAQLQNCLRFGSGCVHPKIRGSGWVGSLRYWVGSDWVKKLGPMHISDLQLSVSSRCKSTMPWSDSLLDLTQAEI